MRVPRSFARIAAVVAVAAMAIAISGCAGPPDRNAVLDELSPAPISPAAWSRIVGTYTGPIRASTIRSGFEGLAAISTRLDLSGSVVLRMDKGYSTSWTMYGEKKGTFTNIPSRRYGSQGTATASTHFPDQVLITIRRDGTLSHEGTWMILTFHANGNVDVDWIGRSGYRGTGELARVPSLAGFR
jgi:hypothetical protein